MIHMPIASDALPNAMKAAISFKFAEQRIETQPYPIRSKASAHPASKCAFIGHDRAILRPTGAFFSQIIAVSFSRIHLLASKRRTLHLATAADITI